MNRLIDTHFHLDHYRNYEEISKQITALEQYTICVTNNPGVFNSCKTMIPETKYLKFAIGLHPQDRSIKEQDLRYFAYLLAQTSYIGEVGLDYTKKSYLPKNTQLRFFDSVVKLSASSNKLLTVHLRNAEKEAINILSQYRPKKCIIHWFTGDEELINEFFKLGCYFSVNTNMINCKTKSKYKAVPIERLLVESDGPYTKVNGKRYTPILLRESYNQIADYYGYGIEDFSNVIMNNFRSILNK